MSVGISIGIAIASFAFSALMRPKKRRSPVYKTTENAERVATDMPLPVVYGENRVDGHIVYREESLGYVYDLAVAFCEGPVEAINQIRVGGIDIGDLVKKRYVATTISFTAPDTISDSAGGFVDAGYEAGEDIFVRGSDGNDYQFRIDVITATNIIIDQNAGGATYDTITNESAGDEITITTNCAWRAYTGTQTQNPDSKLEAGMVHLRAVADAYVDEANAGINYNGDTVTVGYDNPDEKRGLLKFELSDLPSGITIEEATLKLHLMDRTGGARGSNSISVYKASTESWDEDTVTWSTPAPSPTGDAIDVTRIKGGAYSVHKFEFDDDGIAYLQSALTGGTTASFVLTAPTTGFDNSFVFSSRESEYMSPELHIKYSGGQACAFRNTAYAVLTLNARDTRINHAVPEIDAVIHGIQILNWDTVGSAWQTTYTCNPVWIINDIMTHARYAAGIDTARINTDALKAAAAHCATSITGPDGTDETRWLANIVYDQQGSALDALDDLLALFGGFRYDKDGQIHIGYEWTGDVEETFDTSNIIEGSFRFEQIDRTAAPNRIKVFYTDAADGFKKQHVQVEDEVDQDTRGIIEHEVNLYACNTPTQASRTGRTLLYGGLLKEYVCRFRVSVNHANIAPGVVVHVTHPVPGWTNRPMRVVSVDDLFDDEIDLVLEDYVEEVYTDDGIPSSYRERPEPNDIPDPYDDPLPVTDLALEESYRLLEDGTFISTIEVSYELPGSGILLGVYIWLKKGASGTWQRSPVGLHWRNLSAVYIDVDSADTYYVKVQTYSEWTRTECYFPDCPEESIIITGLGGTVAYKPTIALVWSTNSRAEWSSGHIVWGGVRYDINSGYTTNKYIWLDINTSITTLQTGASLPAVTPTNGILPLMTYDISADTLQGVPEFGLITVNQVAFAAADGTNIVATINASSEGITINADKIEINGTTTFASGYDPTDKVAIADVGEAAYMDVADFGFGDMAFEDLVEAAKLGSTIIQGGYIKADLLSADNIVTGTLTGRTIQTAPVGWSRIILSPEDGYERLEFRDTSENVLMRFGLPGGTSMGGYALAFKQGIDGAVVWGTTGVIPVPAWTMLLNEDMLNMRYNNNDTVVIQRDSGNAMFAGTLNLPAETASRAAYFDAGKNIRSSSITLAELGYLSGASSNIQSQLNAITTGYTQITAITDIRLSGGVLQKKTRTAYVVTPSAESAWTNAVPGVLSLNDLTDVHLGAPGNGDVLTFDGVNQWWIDQAP